MFQHEPGTKYAVAYPEGWLTVHFGVRGTIDDAKAQAERLAQIMDDLGFPSKQFVDGDDWIEWGEPHKDGHAWHAQIAVDSFGLAFTIAAWIKQSDDFKSALDPITVSWGWGYEYAVVSFSEDWATTDQLREFIQRHDIIQSLKAKV